MPADKRCANCGIAIDDDASLVLGLGDTFEPYCSDTCLLEAVRDRQRAAVARRRRWFVAALFIALVPSAAKTLWKRYRMPPTEAIVYQPPELPPEPPPPEPIRYGPAWPPTDDDWMAAFAAANWVYPLPGPVRRVPSADGQMFGSEAGRKIASVCRSDGHCGVDLGGELWGEHVYAALDGVVDRVQGAGNEEHGGQYVRLSHFGGMVFTQYFHLAGTPRTLVRGAHVRAGEVIALLGDTGTRDGRRHLCFALSVRPSAAFPETYWDPSPLMATWPLRIPPQGTVAGFSPGPERDNDLRRRRRPR